METLAEAARTFLSERRIAVAGVSRTAGGAANTIYKKLRSLGYAVYAVNPHAMAVEGDPCFPNLAAIEGGVEALIIATKPERAAGLIEQCAARGVRLAWIHGTFAAPKAPADAIEAARKHGITLIAGSCPMLFLEPVDPAHRCLRWFRTATKKEPEVTAAAAK